MILQIEKELLNSISIQEVILSSIYIVETIRILRVSLQDQIRRLMQQLVFINIVIILMDTALLSIEYASLYLFETVIKGVCYSIKLKLEFAILSRLVKFVGGADRSVGFVRSEGEIRRKGDDDNVADFVDVARIGTDITHASKPSNKNTRVDDIDIECARFEHAESAKWRGKDGDDKEHG
jgi:hypothetical protein